MKKKNIFFSILGICLLVTFVSAGLITYYNYFEQEIQITSPISVEGSVVEDMECLSGHICTILLYLKPAESSVSHAG